MVLVATLRRDLLSCGGSVHSCSWTEARGLGFTAASSRRRLRRGFIGYAVRCLVDIACSVPALSRWLSAGRRSGRTRCMDMACTENNGYCEHKPGCQDTATAFVPFISESQYPATSKFYRLISVYCHSVNLYLLESSILQLT